MSILFTLVTFLLFITISYLRHSRTEEAARAPQLSLTGVRPPEMIRELGFEIPKGYAFQPGHTWMAAEGDQNARVGIDSFAATLLGKVDAVEPGSLNRWVRQGQKLLTIIQDGHRVQMISPVEGVVTAVNPKVLEDPSLITSDPYGEGWIVKINSPDLDTNVKNLIRGTMVRPWMAHTLARFRELTQPLVGAVAQDGGMPVNGLLLRVDKGMQRALVREFFLT
jgi:glycine cleavage system H protein